MNWTRTILGSPGRGLGRSRWPFTSLFSVVLAVFWFAMGEWLWGLAFLALAAVSAFLTMRR